MEMFRHNHIPDHHKPIAPAHALQHREEELAARVCTQHRLTLITTARDEVQIARAIKTLEELRHMTSIDAQPSSKM
jgi:hypothetical protein